MTFGLRFEEANLYSSRTLISVIGFRSFLLEGGKRGSVHLIRDRELNYDHVLPMLIPRTVGYGHSKVYVQTLYMIKTTASKSVLRASLLSVLEGRIVCIRPTLIK